MSRARLNVFLEREHRRRLDEVAATRNVSKSSLIGAALAAFLSPEGANHREAAIARRLDRLGRRMERLERDQTILIETLALFVRHQLSVSAPIPEAHLDAARAQGRARFEEFVEQLVRHLQQGRRLVSEVGEELVPAADAFFDVPDAAAAEDT